MRRDSIDLIAAQQYEQFYRLSEQAQKLVQHLIRGQNVFEQSLATQTTTTTHLHQTTETNLKQHIDDGRAQIIQAIADEQNQYQLKEKKSKEDLILQHLSFPTLEVRYESIDPVHARTFNWIFEDFKASDPNSIGFIDWLEGGGDSLFWINGKAGSGKSTLMKYIYDDPRTREKVCIWARGQNVTMASFFFWISGNADQCSQTGLLRSLLRHLLQQHRHLIREVFPDLWKTVEISTNLRAWSLSYASEALANLLRQDLGKVVLFIDGLDEYHGDHSNHLDPERPEHYREIVSLLNSMSSTEVKICFSSRPLLIFHNHFDQRPKLRLEDLTSNDIYTYAKDKLIDDPMVAKLRAEYDWDPSQIVSSIVTKANGVFLWVVLVVRSLLNGIDKFDDFEKLMDRLNEIPQDLMKVYEYMLKQIEPQYRMEGFKIFAIAGRALTMAHKQKQAQGENFSGGHCEELCMIGLWFGLEFELEQSKSPQALTTLTQSLLKNVDIARAIRDIDRKLKTRCAGLLETGPAMPTEDWGPDRDWYDRDNVLLESRFGNRKLQYIHRSAKDLLDLDQTKACVEQEILHAYDPKLSLLWSAIQRIRIYEAEPHRPMVDRGAKIDTLCLADSALLLAQSIQDEDQDCPIELLDLLDSTIEHRQSNEPLSWVADAMHQLYSYHSRYSKPHSRDESSPSKLVALDSGFDDDLLSLAIVYGLFDYVKFEIKRYPRLVQQKKGRPYLDYALTNHKCPTTSMKPRMVRLLLGAGARPDEHCPTIYSIPNCSESSKGRYINFGYTTWTAWQSALQSILRTEAGRTSWRSDPLTSQQCQDWIIVLKDLLARKPDVSVVTWILFKRDPDESYTVPEAIETVFSNRYPEDI